jgi:glycosyltransferase involved in cell wall biosynthesis
MQNDITEQINKSDFKLPASTRFFIPPKDEIIPGYKNFSLKKKYWTALSYRWKLQTLSSADSSILNIVSVLNSIRNNHYDFVVFEHIESLRLYKKINSLFPLAKIIFDAHNVDHFLLHDIANKRRLKNIRKAESSLYKKCDIVFTASVSDAEILRSLNKNKIQIEVVPNGVDVEKNPFQLPDFNKNPKKIIFCGSLDYEPNQVGLLWFLKDVWPDIVKKHPGIILLVVGRGIPDQPLMNLLNGSPHIKFIGEVETVIPYYREVQCAIIPLLHGSGTRLKILEAMSLGIPVISTKAGAEGLNYKDGENIVISNMAEDFSESIDRVYDSDNQLLDISKNAREFVVQEYSWNVIGNSLKIILRDLANK